MKLVVKCSWCKRTLGHKNCKSLSKDLPRITHSICSACKEKLLREMEEDFVQIPKDRNQKTFEGRI